MLKKHLCTHTHTHTHLVWIQLVFFHCVGVLDHLDELVAKPLPIETLHRTQDLTMHSHYDTALNNTLTLMTWQLTMHSHHEHHQWSHHLQTFARAVHHETSTTFQCSFVLLNTSLRGGPSNSSVPGGVTDTCESVTQWISTWCPPYTQWCHRHMWLSYTEDFNMLSTLHSGVSQTHVTQLHIGF